MLSLLSLVAIVFLAHAAYNVARIFRLLNLISSSKQLNDERKAEIENETPAPPVFEEYVPEPAPDAWRRALPARPRP